MSTERTKPSAPRSSFESVTRKCRPLPDFWLPIRTQASTENCAGVPNSPGARSTKSFVPSKSWAASASPVSRPPTRATPPVYVPAFVPRESAAVVPVSPRRHQCRRPGVAAIVSA